MLVDGHSFEKEFVPRGASSLYRIISARMNFQPVRDALVPNLPRSYARLLRQPVLETLAMEKPRT